MAFPVRINTFVIPTGAGPNDSRIVLNGVTGQIEIYGAGGVPVGVISSSGFFALSGALNNPNTFVQMVADTQSARLVLRPEDIGSNTFIPGELIADYDDTTNQAGYIALVAPLVDAASPAPVPTLLLTSRGLVDTTSEAALSADAIVLTGDLSFSGWYIGREVTKFKTASLTKTNQAALFSDPDITWPALPVGTYILSGDLVMRTSAVANDVALKWLFTGTASGGYVVNGPSITVSGGLNALNTDESTWGATTGHGVLTTDMRYQVHGMLRVTVAGDLTLQFSQNPAAAGTSITMSQNTWVSLKKVA